MRENTKMKTNKCDREHLALVVACLFGTSLVIIGVTVIPRGPQQPLTTSQPSDVLCKSSK